MCRECREILLQTLLISDIGKHSIKDWNTAALCRRNRNPTGRHKSKQTHRLEDYGLAASVGTGDDDLISTRIHVEVHGDHSGSCRLQIKGGAALTLPLSPE